MNNYSRLILRIGLGLVFLYFGLSQLINPERWTDLLPEFLTKLSLFKPETFILINGMFDILVGLCLLLGLFVRIISLLAFLHLISISLFSLGLNPSGIRDLGLAISALSLFFTEEDKFSLDYKIKKRVQGNKQL
jgi:uncharacterized membrane protein YphA (DoxX/SURF4 family)